MPRQHAALAVYVEQTQPARQHSTGMDGWMDGGERGPVLSALLRCHDGVCCTETVSETSVCF